MATFLELMMMFSFSWDDKRAGTKILLSQGYLEKNIEDLEVGLLYKGSESNLQYVTTSSFLILTYAEYVKNHSGGGGGGMCGVSADKVVELAKKQVDYILGDNPGKRSHMVGFGERYPQRLHHRASSLPSLHAHPARISCGDGFQYLNMSSPNPNILIGAIVGGPDSQDKFADDRNNFHQSEPTTYINAPFIGALTFFSQYL
ncbi:hypothetical protein SASPL_141474 [Salvia splendens]|uniref:Endoglucanase n=1 Tax=Salvia splendens TaxID=180675 RepID=A0A8X8ZCL3_SALSN|nr:hypothetical protein SASPL_141474 [Salvia splendens]